MRILMLAPSPKVKGPLNKHTPYLIHSLQALGCEISVESWGRHKEQETYFEKGIGRFRDILRVQKTLKNRAVDVLVIKTAHDWATLSRDIPLLLATRHLCQSVVIQFHGSSPNKLVVPGNFLFKFFSRWLIQLSDAALVLSTEEQGDWQKFYPDGLFYLVNNPFVPAEIEPKGLTQKTGEQELPVLLFVGRLIREKGIFDLLDAASLLSKNVSFELLVAGEGVATESVKQKINQLGLTSKVTLAGYLKGKELIDAYRNANIFVFPTYWCEGFPTVIAEAMSASLPIVTTFIRGSADHLVPEVNALFIPPREPAVLAAALYRLLKDPELCSEMGRANHEKVKDFSPERAGKLYLEALQDVLKRTFAFR